MCARLNTYRLRAVEGGLEGFDQRWGTFSDFYDWVKSRRKVSEQSLVTVFKELYEVREECLAELNSAYLSVLFPERVDVICFDVFGAYEPSDINQEYRDSWKTLIKLAGKDVSVQKIRTKKRKIKPQAVMTLRSL